MIFRQKISNNRRVKIALKLVEYYAEQLAQNRVVDREQMIIDIYEIAHTGIRECGHCREKFDMTWLPRYYELKSQREIL